MNKFKVLGVALMVSIILLIASAYALGLTSIDYALSGNAQAILFISGLCIMLFGSLSALTVDKLN